MVDIDVIVPFQGYQFPNTHKPSKKFNLMTRNAVSAFSVYMQSDTGLSHSVHPEL